MRAIRWYAILIVVMSSCPANAQGDRRDRQEPELTVETGARTGTCDAMTFTADGKFLIAVGDDKVARIWPVTEQGFDRKNATVLRWPSWREQRGGIKAMALPRDVNDPRIAIGGYGMRTSTVAILDRTNGKIVQIIAPDPIKGRNFFAVMSITFSPDGKKLAFGTADGSVFVWDLAKEKPTRIGDHGGTGLFNRVRMVEFVSESKLLTVAEQGQFKEWDASLGAQEGTERPSLLDDLKGCAGVFRAVLSPDRSLMLALGSGPMAVVKPLGEGETRSIKLGKDEFCRSGAFTTDGKRIAIGYGRAMPAPEPRAPRYFMESDDEILLVTIADGQSIKRPGPRHIGRAEALAWHSDGRLAIAGGDHHEITLYESPDKAERPADTLIGAGRCLYGVRLSEDGRYVAFRADRDEGATHPNARSKGEWSVFDIQRRAVVKMPADVAFPEPLRTIDGWAVEPDLGKSYVWHVVTPDKRRLELPFDKNRDETPRCYAFIPAKEGQPLRLAIGHYYGVSVFEITETNAKRVFLGTGHADEVLALAPSPDGKWLITAGRDQTLSAWSLEPWNAQARLGVAFDDNLKVTKVDAGSPGWEAGFLVGDELAFLAVGTKPIHDTMNRTGTRIDNAAEALRQLRDPEPGKEIYFGVKREGRDKPIENLTTVRQRPLWRMFPAFTGKTVTDWVVWMWRGSYYHTSTNGDFLIGWHVNHPTMEREPTFHPAQLFRDVYHKPGVITDLINTRDVSNTLKRAMGNNPIQVNFAGIEPAPARIEALGTTVGPDGLKLTLVVEPRGNNPDLLPERVELWCEEFRLERWETNGAKFRKDIVISQDRLRSGENIVTLQAINGLGGRSQYTVKLVNPRKPDGRELYGIAVGINDYKQSGREVDGTRSFGDLKAAKNDATQLQESWAKQKGKLYSKVAIELKLDANATRDQILDELDQLAKTVRPDDQLVMFLSGHGDFLPVARENGRGDGVFVFCCPTYDRDRYKTTGISTAEIYEKLAMIPCRKLVFLDACHSGQAAVNPVRSLTPGGKGPTILAACDQNEFAFENPKFGNGLFTYAMLEALGVNFSQADGKIDDKPDGQLDPAELFEYVRGRMPELLKDIGRLEDQQNPVCFPREPERFPVAQK